MRRAQWISSLFIATVLSSGAALAQEEVSCDFVNGSGVFSTSRGANAKFGLSAGVQNGSFFGHLVYSDPGIGLKLKASTITGYRATDAHTRVVEGMASTNFFGTLAYRVTATDNGEAGDIFQIELVNGYLEGGTLRRGQIQIQSANASTTPPPGSTCQGTADTVAPAVTMTSPAEGSTVSGTVKVSANASDNAKVAKVQFKLDGADLGAADTKAPYFVFWDTTTGPDGKHILTAVATDTSGNTATSAPVSVTVSNAPPADATPPTVIITSPAEGSTVFATVAVTADASDNVGVAKVEFFVDGVKLGEDPTSPFSVSWDTTTVPDGSHSLTARATDTSTNTGTSAPVMVTVANGAPPPPPAVTRIEETSPSITYTGDWIQGDATRAWSGGTAAFSGAAGARATLSFTGTGVSWISFRGPQTGIARVFLDGALVAEVDTFAPAEETQVVLFTASGLADTAHTLAIEVTGTKNPSSSNFFIVVDAFDVTGGAAPPPPPPADTTPPAVTITSPAEGSTVSATVAVSADASDNVGVAKVEFFVDGVKLSEDATSPFSASWDTTTVPDGSHSLTAVAHDGAGNTATSAPVGVTVSNGTPPPPPGTVTRIEETDPSITYLGGWAVSVSRPWSGGAANFSSEHVARATLSFTGTGVSWIGFRSPMSGIARVFLDGVLAAEVNTFAPAEEVGAVLFTRSGLAATTHTLTVEVTGKKDPGSTDTLIVVDAFDVTDGGPAAPVPVGRIQETDPAVAYTGVWTQGDMSRRWSGGTAAFTGEALARATLSFTGTSVNWIGFRSPMTGIARVFLDGALVAEVDTFAAVEEGAVLFTASGLTATAHTLAVEVTGAANPSSSAAFIVVDAFDVTP